MFSRQIRGHTVIPCLFDTKCVVIDAGAHKGEFAREIERRFHSPVIALEANPVLNATNCSTTLLDYRPVALARQSGTLEFHVSSDAECSSVLKKAPNQSQTVSVRAISLDDLVSEIDGDIGCLKLDIEGAEVEVLMTAMPATLQRCKQITCEFHDFMYAELTQGVSECMTRMRQLGFACCVMSRKTHEDVLFVRGDLASSMLFRLWTVNSIDKYCRGIIRVLRRKIGA